MARFILRIELHKKPNRVVTVDDYAFLHSELKKRGYKDEVTYEGDSRVYQLPTGLYRKVADVSLNEADKLAHEAGKATINGTQNVESYSFFLAEYSNSTKYNLKVLRP